MSSTIFYRFKSQKNTSRILFDGTGITVFDLKKEIINDNNLAPATDFDLHLYKNDTNEEYTDDTIVIPRSTLVIAKRSPPVRNGKGTAARYITGKAKMAKIVTTNNSSAANGAAGANGTNGGDDKQMSEEDRINMMFATQGDQWKETQQHMSTATPVYNKPTASTGNNPEDVPPPGYMCYRCGSKDHWIKNCPTNDDPNWEGKRVKRTTGIPKAYLKTVENPEEDDMKNYMMNEEGKYVVQVADAKAWETYKKKVNKTTSLMNELNKDVDPEFLDPINHKVMQDPVTTPCCSKNYSRSTIEDALLESDFICPNCNKPDIFLDSLIKNDELNNKIESFLDSEFEKRGVKRQNDNSELDKNKRQQLDPIVPLVPPFFPPFPMMPVPVPQPQTTPAPAPVQQHK